VEAAEHQADHGDTNKAFVVLRQFFAVSSKVTWHFQCQAKVRFTTQIQG
jgi:hypothetical protein